MKKILYLSVIILFLAACNGAEKAYQKGNYDLAIKKSVKKIKKDPYDAAHLRILEESYINANRIDNDRIAYLKKENRPESSEELFQLYTKLKSRQDIVKTSPNIPAGIKFEDYDQEIINAKSGAAEYHYAKGEQLLASESHYDARLALDEFNKTKSFFSDYKDVNNKIEQSKVKGTSNVKIELVNNAPQVKLPSHFTQKIKMDSLNVLKTDWINYSYPQDGIEYYYTIRTNITKIIAPREANLEKQFKESKQVVDGWEYKKDAEGKELKDSLGNKIKIDKYKTIFCDVKQEITTKKVTINWQVEYFENGKTTPVKTFPYVSEGIFNQVISYPNGDMAALSDETKKTVNLKPQPIPTVDELILLTGDDFKQKTFNTLKQNQALIK